MLLFLQLETAVFKLTAVRMVYLVILNKAIERLTVQLIQEKKWETWEGILNQLANF